jgi:hypothetical protein
MLWMVMALVFGAGCVGGAIPLLTNRQKFGSGSWGLLYKRKACDTWFPGALGQVVVGGVAAVVFWGLYGPWADWPLLGGGLGTLPKFTLSQLVAPVLMGIGGQDWLRAQAERRCYDRLSRSKQE